MTRHCTTRAGLFLCLALSLLAGCASQPVARKDPRDPWERMNRVTQKFNDGFENAIALPVGHGYKRVVPNFMQIGIGNFMDNIQLPITIVADLLQAKPKLFANDTGRFLLNSTVGLGGILDPATPVGLSKNVNDMGRTFGTWGLPPGPYFVIPVLGPSSVRDAVGKIPDGYYLAPSAYIKSWQWSLAFYGVYGVDLSARYLIPTEDTLRQVNPYDRYAFIRNAWLQRREYLIHGTTPKSDDETEQELLKELENEDKTSPSPSPAPAPTPTPPTPPTPPK
jgi:phospholipid-binding lipoprotein MlaA